jgi:hypothetical protein
MRHAGAGEPVKALWVGYPDRARADTQKTLGEFFGNMPVDRFITGVALPVDGGALVRVG